ncbi:DNA photolyase 2 [Chrysodeixis chalcites SNPV TF1-A]|uniref:Deoxyribodipyrimidine photo-lyase n=1 Tax=Chrysodeixis chalcites nucleopolyhedrovirus TaxID=320432 RepID=T1R018_9ABAC|nr:DNA photolyase 2 [Chrysodeixis chalcites SNPV TF1-A]AGE61481.1 DNA photolyase 2 [Chrysodeixis chalcites nucleopolyhedrovirus]
MAANDRLKRMFEESRIDSSGETCHPSRVRVISRLRELVVASEGKEEGGVVYWMSRDSRVQDNWALIYAQELAHTAKLPLYVVFCMTKSFNNASMRQFHFLIKGLEEVRVECQKLDITFVMLDGSADLVLNDWVREHDICAVVCDFNPLRTVREWVSRIRDQLPDTVYFAQVDAHNVVPCWVASNKQEYNAMFMRKKLNSKLECYLKPFPPVVRHEYKSSVVLDPCTTTHIDWQQLLASRDADVSVGPVDWIEPGYISALNVLAGFIRCNLLKYKMSRNNPVLKTQSNMSPFYHFGQISVQRVMLHLNSLKINKNDSGIDSNINDYIEECFVRRELADNFCFYNSNYDTFLGAPNWAKETLVIHKSDSRQYIYSLLQFEHNQTHDELWNAAQRQLRNEGKIHGYLRMYWAKKILEWTRTPEQALEYSIYLNDRYSLDGRDPNGYVGCMWSICGLHDRSFLERQVFGKIRYMNRNGCERKFNVKQYIINNK